MKIGIDISQIVHPGGVGTYTGNLVNKLLAIDKVNDYLLFGASLRKYQLLKKAFKGKFTAKFYTLPPTLTEYLFNRLHFPPIEFFTGKIDVFHSSDWMEPRAICPKITTVHDLAPIIFPQKHDKKILDVFKRKLALVKKEAKVIIAVSKSTKKDLVERLEIDENKIRVIYEALDENFVKAKADLSVINKFELKQFIISDALKNERKNLKKLLLAFNKIKNKELQLVLPGIPLWGIKEIKDLVSQSAAKDRIKLIGMVEVSSLKALYEKALAAVFPSLYEGFGLAVLEAMSCGCPTIVSNVSSLPEVVGNAGILVNPRDEDEIGEAINRVTNNVSVARTLREKGKQQVKKFSWEIAAKETLAVYREAINK
jgi:glycosyltransferase involved in cell wall biosynthesis